MLDTYFANTASSSAGYGTSQFRGFLNSNARVIDENTLDRQMRAYEASHPAFAHVVNQMTTGYSPRMGGNRNGLKSMFAAMLGYNVIRESSSFDPYTTVLNRKAVTVSSKTKRARYGMSDW